MHGADPLIGRELGGRFRLIRQLGKGGMGTVYLARHETLQRNVVVKVISRDRLEPEVVTRFRREALAVGQLAHPNVVSVHDFGVADDGMMFLVMELLIGSTLAEVMDAEGALAPERAIEIASDIARGLAHAHERGVVHRDLKPGNVMVVDVKGGRSVTKILDFGIAKVSAASPAAAGLTATLTGSGIMLGTPGYIAPEHVHGVHDDPRSDLYSLGCIVFEMLTGTQVFHGETPMKVVLRHVAERAPRVIERRPDVPAPLDALVMRLLAKAPDDRPVSADALLVELAALASSTSSATLATGHRMPAPDAARRAEPSTRVSPFDAAAALAMLSPPSSQATLVEPVAPRARRGAVPAATLAVAVVVLGAAVGYSMLRPPPPRAASPAAAVLPPRATATSSAPPPPRPAPAATPAPSESATTDAGVAVDPPPRPPKKPVRAVPADDGFTHVHTPAAAR